MARQTPVNPGFTIVSGAGTGSNGDRIDVWMEYGLGQPDVRQNYTPVTVYFYAALAEEHHASTALNYGLDAALQVDGLPGQTVSNGPYDFTDPAFVNTLGSFSGNIYHDADGAKQLTLEGSFTTRSSYISGGFVSAAVALPPIAKASTLGATDGEIGKTAVIAVAVKNSSWCHSIQYFFGQLSGYITAQGGVSPTEVIFGQTAIPFAIPEDFYYEIPDAAAGVCRLVCRTYDNGAPVGEPQRAEFTVTAPESACGPLLTGSARDIAENTLALTGDDAVLIPGYSVLRCLPEPVARKGATIVQLQVNGQPVTEQGVILEQVTRAPEFSVTDSRGYTARFTPPVQLLPYIPLTNNAAVSRDDPTSGNVTVQLNGSFYEGSFGARENALQVFYALEGQRFAAEPVLQAESGVYSGSFGISGLDYTKTHRLEVTVADGLGQVSRMLTVNKGMPVFDWGEEDFCFHVPVRLPQLQIGNVTLADYIRQVVEGGIQ